MIQRRTAHSDPGGVSKVEIIPDLGGCEKYIKNCVFQADRNATPGRGCK